MASASKSIQTDPESNPENMFPINPIQNLIKFYEDDKAKGANVDATDDSKNIVILEDRFNVEDKSTNTVLVAEDAISCSPSQCTQSSTGSSR